VRQVKLCKALPEIAPFFGKFYKSIVCKPRCSTLSVVAKVAVRWCRQTTFSKTALLLVVEVFT
jgi:hypothetical protein